MIDEERFPVGNFPKCTVLSAVYGYLRDTLSYPGIEELIEKVVLSQITLRFNAGLSIPEQSGHRFHGKADTDSIPFRTLIPFESGQ